MNEELVSVEDFFENEDIVLVKSRYRWGKVLIERCEVGVKDDEGDIVKFIRLKDISYSYEE